MLMIQTNSQIMEIYYSGHNKIVSKVNGTEIWKQKFKM